MDGAFYIYTCVLSGSPASWKWTFISNKIDIAIYKNDMASLNAIVPPDGTRAYVKSAIVGEVNEYIYGDDSDPLTNNWRKVSTP